MNQLHWPDYARDGEYYGIGRSFMTTKQLGVPHTHDFVELWWVDEGSGYHLVNDAYLPVQRGDLVLMRADDGHAFGNGDFSITNVFFQSETIAHLRDRYFADDDAFWGGASSLPFMRHLAPSQLVTLSHEAELLAQGDKQLVRIERFLLNLLEMLYRENPPPALLPLPYWLQHACRHIHEPEHLRLGTPAFVQLTGKSPEHVSRVVRQLLSSTPHQLVTGARMAHAAMLLEMTPRPIIEIAYDCGYDSLSSFYRVFKDTYRITPRAYRRRMPHV